MTSATLFVRLLSATVGHATLNAEVSVGVLLNFDFLPLGHVWAEVQDVVHG